MRKFGGPLIVAALTLFFAIVVVAGLWRAWGATEDAIEQDRRSVQIAELQEHVVDVLIALIDERGRLELGGSESDALSRVRSAVDTAESRLEAEWASTGADARQRSGLDEVFTVLDQVRDLRASADAGDSYSLLIAAIISALRESNVAFEDGSSLQNRRGVSALVDLVAALAQQRRLVGRAILDPGGPASGPAETSIATELEVTSEQAATALARFEEIRTDTDLAIQPVGRDPEVVAVVDRALDARVDTGVEEWWSLAGGEIDAAREAIADLTAELIEDRSGSISNLETERVIEGAAVAATVGLTTLVAAGAYASVSYRRRATAEYEALASGIQDWFHSSTIPELAGIDAAAAYRPASDHAKAGGDWYDLFTVGETIIAVVGDVTGHGPRAVADMARIRHLVRGLSHGDGAVLDFAQLEERLGDPPMVATATVVAIDLANRRLRYHRAGHPPPLLRHRDRSVEILDGAADPPIGAMLPYNHADTLHDFDPGDVLVLYSDGLIERQDEVITDSIAELALHLAGARSDAADVVEDLTTGLTEVRDDVAILAIRATEPTEP